MGRPKKPAPQHVEPEDISQEEPETEEAGADAPEAASRGGTIKKVDAVRNALAAGKDTPDEGTAYIRQHYGIDMANTQFSTVKSQLKKKEGEAQPARKAAAPRKLKPLVEGYVAPPPKPQGEPDVLLALEAIKPLVAEYGADKLKRIVDLLS